MAMRTRIEPTLFQCPNCKKKYFSYQERVLCPECTKEEEGRVSRHDTDEQDTGVSDISREDPDGSI